MPVFESPLVTGRTYRFKTPPPRLLFLREAPRRKSQRTAPTQPKRPQSKTDEWVQRRLAASKHGPTGSTSRAATRKDLQCALEIRAIDLSPTPGGPFEDPTLFTLTLTVLAPEGSQAPLPQSPTAAIDVYCGSPDDDDAPLWLARWPRVTTFDVSDSRAALANLCMRLIAHRANLEMPGLSIQMVEWALLASLTRLKKLELRR